MDDLKSYSVLSRKAFDEFVDGELRPWRRCVKKWQDSKSKPEWVAKSAIQSFLDSAHDQEILNFEMKTDVFEISFRRGVALRFLGVEAVTIDPVNEKPSFAFLYGEVFTIANQTFTHLLCDVVDIYVLSENVELAQASESNI
jgi:hypothetical protein